MRNPLPAASTFSKDVRLWSGEDWTPTTIVAGKGAQVLGDDGVWRTDWVSSLGALALGHPDTDCPDSPASRWAAKVCVQVWKGAGYSLASQTERRLADRLVALLADHVPGWGTVDLGVRFTLSGSSACAAAIRLARAATGRMRVISIGYHGYFSEFVSTTPPARGVWPSQGVEAVPYGDLDQLAARMQSDQIGLYSVNHNPVAAVIIEQPPQPIPPGYWQGVRNLCDRFGALLIVDEVVTGWRYAIGGACERFDIHPDLCCYAKALGNTIPCGCIVGKRDLFDVFDLPSPAFISGTALGNSVSLAACEAVLDVWTQESVDYIWSVGLQLIAGFKLAGWQTTGYPPVFLVNYASDAERAYTVARLRDHGILANRPWIPNLAHTWDDVKQTIEAMREIRREIDAGAELPTRLPAVLFRGR